MKNSTNPFDDDSDDDSYDDDEMARALEAMDIDTDFDCWTSFRASMSIKTNSSSRTAAGGSRSGAARSAGSIPEEDGGSGHRGGGGASPFPPPATSDRRSSAPRSEPELTPSERSDVDKWSRRLRPEVYSAYYKPVPRESREIRDLSRFLGVSKDGGTGSSRRILDKLPNPLKQETDKNTTERAPIKKLLFPTEDEPKSILLKRGPVLLRRGGAAGERELILLSHGFIVATPVDQQPAAAPPAPPAADGFPTPSSVPKFLKKIPSGLNKKLIHRHFETAEDLTAIVAVEDVDLVQRTSEEEENSFAIVAEKGDGTKCRYVFTCAKAQQKEAWLEALTVSVVQVNMHHIEGRSDHQIGWQHDILRTSIYSAAVRGDDAMLRGLLSKNGPAGRKPVNIDALDSYCGYTALHYAAVRNRLSSMEALLQAGASAVAMDKDLRSPIFYAERFKHRKAVHLLESYGATRPPPVTDETSLFGAAAINARDHASNEKASHFAQIAKTKGVAGTMDKNMAAMRERGERLDRLENKTAQLETNAAAYGDTARQLKEKAKKQHIFGL